MMAASRIIRPASRFWSCSPSPLSFLNALRPASSLLALPKRRTYATPSGVKELAVRDALNEALAEELESNSKVFVLGEEVAQYNGASVIPVEPELLMKERRDLMPAMSCSEICLRTYMTCVSPDELASTFLHRLTL